MSEIEQYDAGEVEESSFLQKMDKIEEVGLYDLKGYSYSQINQLTGLSIPTIKKYIKEYKVILERVVDDDPYFLENIQYNTIKAMKEMDEVSREAWESIELATREGMLTARNQAIKLALEVATKKAQLHQLLGQQNQDTDYIERMQKAELVNSLISQVVRDVVSECEHCRVKARPLLEEAFKQMESSEEFMSPKDAADRLDFIDVDEA